MLVIDDVLATGGTAAATCRLVEELGGVIVGLGFLIEIDGLNGRRASAIGWSRAWGADRCRLARWSHLVAPCGR